MLREPNRFSEESSEHSVDGQKKAWLITDGRNGSERRNQPATRREMVPNIVSVQARNVAYILSFYAPFFPICTRLCRYSKLSLEIARRSSHSIRKRANAATECSKSHIHF